MISENELAAGRSTVPSFGRRLASLPYEGLLLLAIVLIAAFPAAVLRELLPNGMPQFILQAYLLCVIAGYFTWFWSHGGQTLAMKTWRIRVIGADGMPISPARALLRVAIAGLFFGPACVGLVLLFFPRVINPLYVLWTFLPLFASFLWARFDDHRQFLHDRLAATRLVSVA